jgi:xanthine permease
MKLEPKGLLAVGRNQCLAQKQIAGPPGRGIMSLIEETVHPVDAVPPPGRLTVLGLQHLFVMYAGAIAVPFVIGSSLGMSPADIAQMVSANTIFAGLGTILTTVGLWKFGARLPIVLGPSANVIGPLILIGKTYGLPAVWSTCILAGAAMMICAPIIGRLRRFFPPVVMGTMLALVGIMLVPIGVRLITNFKPDDPVSAKNLIMAGGTILLVALFMKFLPAMLRQMSVLFGLILATAIALALGEADFSRVLQGSLFGFALPAHFGEFNFDIGAAIAVIVLMAVLMFEVLPQLVAVGEMVGREATSEDVQGGVLADGLTSLVGGIFGAFPLVTFSQNIGVLGLTTTRSRFVATAAGVLLVILGLFPPLGRLVAAIPGPIIGGIALVMFTAIGVVGIKILNRVDFGQPQNLFIVATSLGIGFIPMVAPKFYDAWPKNLQTIFNSPVGAGLIAAILLNLLFNHLPAMRTSAREGDHAVPSPGAAKPQQHQA